MSRASGHDIFLTGSSLNTSFTLLHDAEARLKALTHNKFDAAVHSGDAASVERFFKLFPLLGAHEEGLTKFGKYLSSQVSQLKVCRKLAVHFVSLDI